MDYNLDKKKVMREISPAQKRLMVTPPTTPTPPQLPLITGGKDLRKKTIGETSVGVKKTHTEADIATLLDGYINVHPSMWDWIPTGAHIRYFKKGTQSRIDKFKPGGFVKNHFTNDEGKKFIMIENKPGGYDGVFSYVKFPVAYEEMEELWKKYDRNAFIEIHLISTSLAQKKKQIEELQARVAKVESLLAALVERTIKQ